jgi:hypothetical protein
MTDATAYLLDPDTLQAELQQTKQRLAELRRARKLALLARAKERRQQSGVPEKSHTKEHHPPDPSAEGDYAYGAIAIGKITKQTRAQVYYWHNNGMYGNAVWKAGAKSLVGRISKLRNLGPQ